MERESRDTADLRPRRSWLLAVLVVAAAIRLASIGAGIPYAVGVDEPEIMVRVVTMMKSGSLHPHFFDYPGLLFYLHLPVAIAQFMVGAVRGHWNSLGDVGPSDFYLWARVVTALLGTATVLLVYLAGSRWGARHALLGAAMLAVMPLHVRESRFVLTDVPMTFFVTLTWLLSLRAHERATARAFALAGAAAGLAMSAKYTAGVAILMPLVALAMTAATCPSRRLAAGGVLVAWAGAFLLTSPFTVLDLPAFLNAFAYLVTHFSPRPADAEPGWLVYAKHLRIQFQWPATLLALAGAALAITRAIRGPGRLKWLLLVGFPAVYFDSVANSQQIYARYLMPIVPFLCLLIAISVVSGVSVLRRFAIPRRLRTALIVALALAALLPSAHLSVQHVRAASRTSTQELAWKWIEQNIPPRSLVVLEKYDLRLPAERYRTRHVKRLVDETPEAYRNEGARFLVATSQVFGPTLTSPARDPELAAAYRTLFRSVREVARFTPAADRPGPELRILAIE